jgi:hypothetical protein
MPANNASVIVAMVVVTVAIIVGNCVSGTPRHCRHSLL